ncbi:MAG TPA: thioredoxin domain-containing protein [Thermoanaerobaculia bacterium]|nr:thioredoxin domain-containing protein [Thermoanaerobaculia bacterium]
MLWLIFLLSAAAATPPHSLQPDEVLATVNGVAIHRSDVVNSLADPARQSYADALDDLRDLEHAAVRDYAGRQTIEREAKESKTTTDAIYDRILAADYDRFDANLRNRISQQRERIFTAERQSLDELIQKRLLEDAARAKGMTLEELNRSLANRVAPVTKADVDFIKAYEASKTRASESAPPGDARLEAAIRDARIEQMKEALIAETRSQAKIESHLAPPRVTLSTEGVPAVGPSNAPVRVVVFTDFECPYCKESEGTLKRIAAQYGNRVAFYFRNYPLPNHLYAMPSAIASVCAAEQGRYLAYHDLLFAHSEELKNADYAQWAETAGLDRAKFEQCRQSPEARKRVEADIREGVGAGVAGTPTFFVNGRLVRDAGTLRAVVAEEAAQSGR